jgi:hypothetical protein
MTCTGAPPLLAGPYDPFAIVHRVLTKKIRGSLTMASFSFNTAAELFPAAIRKKKRAGFAYRRFASRSRNCRRIR